MYLRRTSKTRLEVSIDEPLNVDWDGNELLLSDILGTEEDVISKNMEAEIERDLLKNAIEHLSPREKRIVELRFGLKDAEGAEMTQKEVADLMGISQSLYFQIGKKDHETAEKGDRTFRVRRSYQKFIDSFPSFVLPFQKEIR